MRNRRGTNPFSLICSALLRPIQGLPQTRNDADYGKYQVQTTREFKLRKRVGPTDARFINITAEVITSDKKVLSTNHMSLEVPRTAVGPPTPTEEFGLPVPTEEVERSRDNCEKVLAFGENVKGNEDEPADKISHELPISSLSIRAEQDEADLDIRAETPPVELIGSIEPHAQVIEPSQTVDSIAIDYHVDSIRPPNNRKETIGRPPFYRTIFATTQQHNFGVKC